VYYTITMLFKALHCGGRTHKNMESFSRSKMASMLVQNHISILAAPHPALYTWAGRKIVLPAPNTQTVALMTDHNTGAAPTNAGW